MNKELQLAQIVDSHDFDGVIDEVLGTLALHYAGEATERVRIAYWRTRDLFEGRFPGYRACSTEYHDLRHTLDVLLASVRLMDGYAVEKTALPQAVAVSLILAALFHDSGYIQQEWDDEGTGAKYTLGHEERGVEFTDQNAAAIGIEDQERPLVATLIRATALRQAFAELPFDDEEQRVAGAMLGSADLLGQMADRQYLEKLLFLYREFREAGIPGYQTEFDILRSTRQFYSSIKERLEGPFGSVFRFARSHFRARHGVDADLYMIAIDRQMDYLDRIMEDDTTNFRHKLKRMSPEELARVGAGMSGG
jgi:hypothetical protein